MSRRRLSMPLLFVMACFLAPFAAPALAQPQPDAEHQARARQTLDRAIAFLRSRQDSASGAWGVMPDDQPQLPAIAALVIRGLLLDPAIDASDPAVNRAVDWILTFRQKDGSICDKMMLPNYNTAIVISALSQIDRPDVSEAIAAAQAYLRGIQWDGQPDPSGIPIDKAHPFFGGAGYGRHQRPDNSNLNMLLEGMHDSGLPGDDPAFQRALVFLQRTQMLDSVNDMPYADGSNQGGFIYSTSVDASAIGSGQTYAKEPMIEETLDDGSVISRLRCYGSMTYAGFKSYLYADLARTDPRVTAAYDWIRRHYTVEENPNVGLEGYYYYLHTMTRALAAWGEPTITTIPSDGTTGQTRNWANDIIDRLASLQRDDGSFANDADRWMEGDPVLVTAYVVLALQYASGNAK